ncbi:hypothetical protein B0H14DRAFT_2599040 [Mycena olivaceomarginata]|nr:hypothetical protein B0H14DRAFT_2599040 [Mycena olivaceomarginata]
MSATFATNSATIATAPTHLSAQEDPSKEGSHLEIEESSESDSETETESVTDPNSKFDEDMNNDPFLYIGWNDEGALVTDLFWHVWNHLEEDLGYSWQDVLDCVKLLVKDRREESGTGEL